MTVTERYIVTFLLASLLAAVGVGVVRCARVAAGVLAAPVATVSQ